MSNHVEFFSGMKRWTMLATVFAFVCIPMKGFTADTIQGAGTVSVTGVAKNASPAVVSISVKSVIQDNSQFFYNGRSYQFEEPFGFFNDPFLQEFFGAPRKERAPRQQPQTGQASGFIVSEDGYILTNAHVVNNADIITVSLNDGREFEATVIGADPNTDVAVVKINATSLPYLKLGNSDDLDVGQWVVAIGNPLGLQTSVTAGVVSAKGRNNLSLARVEDFIQTDAAINRGNSGGPLLNLNSEVIGMNTAIVTNMGSGGYMGIGFAIPSNLIQHVMEELIETGSVTRGFMGVTLQQINHDLAQAFGMDKIEGALVADVSRESPAAKAGIKQGDVILRYNNKTVDNIAALRNGISMMKPGSQIDLTILRNGRINNITLSLGTYPGDQKPASIKRENDLGVDVETLSPEAAKKMGYADLSGVVITNVKAGSPAAWAGLRKGALILAVNHKEITTSDEFYHQLSLIDKNSPVLLLIRQGDLINFVSIKTTR